MIAGQGTVGLEIASQAAAKQANVDAIICCCGGGGLIAGLSIAASDLIPGVKIWSAEPGFYDDTLRSLTSGKRETADINQPSICDAIVTPQPGKLTFPINKQLLSGGAVITDRDALRAMAPPLNILKLLSNPGAPRHWLLFLQANTQPGQTRLSRLLLAVILMRKCSNGRWMKAHFSSKMRRFF